MLLFLLIWATTSAGQLSCIDGCVVGECGAVTKNCTVPPYGSCVRFNGAAATTYAKLAAPDAGAPVVGRWAPGDEAIVLQGPIRATNGDSYFYLSNAYNEDERVYTRYGRSGAVPWFRQCVNTLQCSVIGCGPCVVRGCHWCHEPAVYTAGSCKSATAACPSPSALLVTTPLQCDDLLTQQLRTKTSSPPLSASPDLATPAPTTAFFAPPPPPAAANNDALTIGLAILGAVCAILVVVLVVCIAQKIRPKSTAPAVASAIRVNNAAFKSPPSVKESPALEMAFDLRQQPKKKTSKSPPAAAPPSASAGYVNDSDTEDEPDLIPDQPTAELRRLAAPPVIDQSDALYNQVPGHSKVPILLPPLVDPAYNQLPARKAAPAAAAPSPVIAPLPYSNVPALPADSSRQPPPILTIAEQEPEYDQLQLRQTKYEAAEDAVDVELARDD